MRYSAKPTPLIPFFRQNPNHPASIVYFAMRRAWRALQTRDVHLDHILCGSEHGLTGAQLALHTEDARRTSTPVSNSPHTKLLYQYKEIGWAVLDPNIFGRTLYCVNAMQCVRLFGDYFGATTMDGVISCARNFIRRFNGESIDYDPSARRNGFSNPIEPASVRKIRFSRCYQVADGNHRLAIACAHGLNTVPVRIIKEEQLTQLQTLLLSVSWNANRRHIYQPLNAPELVPHWPLIRRCVDRFALMKQFLDAGPHRPGPTQTYFDIACNYGWFVKAMADLGYVAKGLEVDWAAREIGFQFYGLDRSTLLAGDVIGFFKDNPVKYDIVSCLSLMHHFVMRKGGTRPEDLLNLLDRATNHILFLDMGQDGEEMFGNLLKGWNPSTIAKWIMTNSSFRHVIALGIDCDRAPPFARDYGRTLFACVR